MSEVEKLREQLFALQQEDAKQKDKIEKLSAKLDKERQKYEKEVTEKGNTIALLQKTLHEIQVTTRC